MRAAMRKLALASVRSPRAALSFTARSFERTEMQLTARRNAQLRALEKPALGQDAAKPDAAQEHPERC
jgi:hypothetical protein